jgi:putative spermidine/putrescine transport system substrate-binding protein|tara:strand:- start:9508 stop:10611 length:1104 start_codon:yes stop_codon:yes gene_type:complete
VLNAFAKEVIVKKKSRNSSEITRRKFIQSAATTAGVAGFPYFFVKAHAASDPKVFSAYIYDGNLGEFYDKHWYKPFAEKFDIKIQYIQLKGSRLPMEKVQAQIAAGQPEADVVPMHGDQFIFAKRNNLLEEVGDLPGYADVYDKFVTPYGPGLVLWCYILAYNTEKVVPAPTSWKVLWDPKYSGRIAINEGLKNQVLEMVNITHKGQPYPVDDETFKHLSALRPSLVSMWSSGADAEQLFRNDEIVMTPFWNGRVTKLKGEGLPLEAAVPDEGFFVRYSVYGVPRNAKNPELAKEWLNWVVGKEPQTRMVEFGYGTPNKQVQYTDAQAKAVIVADPEVVKKAVPEDFELILKKSGEWTDMWNKWKSA